MGDAFQLRSRPILEACSDRGCPAGSWLRGGESLAWRPGTFSSPALPPVSFTPKGQRPGARPRRFAVGAVKGELVARRESAQVRVDARRTRQARDSLSSPVRASSPDRKDAAPPLAALRPLRRPVSTYGPVSRRGWPAPSVSVCWGTVPASPSLGRRPPRAPTARLGSDLPGLLGAGNEPAPSRKPS